MKRLFGSAVGSRRNHIEPAMKRWPAITTVSFSGITTSGIAFASFARLRATSLGEDL
jgi:hypothetical protein